MCRSFKSLRRTVLPEDSAPGESVPSTENELMHLGESLGVSRTMADISGPFNLVRECVERVQATLMVHCAVEGFVLRDLLIVPFALTEFRRSILTY